MLPFTGIAYDKNIGASPAAVNIRTGILYINKSVFYSYPEEWQRFIILHEAGHLILQTFDEMKADEYAFHHFVKEGHSLKDAVLSLSQVLGGSHSEHAKRIKTHLDKAFWWDLNVFGKVFIEPLERKFKMNKYLSKEAEQVAYCLGHGDTDTAMKYMGNILLVVDPQVSDQLLEAFAEALTTAQMGTPVMDGDPDEDFLVGFCLGKKACDAQRARLAVKADAKASLITSKATAKENNSLSKLELAKQGIKGDSAADFMNSVSSGLGAIFGGGKGDPAPTANNSFRENFNTDDTGNDDEPKSGPSAGLIIGIVVALILIGVGVYFATRKKATA